MRHTLKMMSLVSTICLSSVVNAGVHLPVPYMSQPDDQTCLPTSFMMTLNFMGRIHEFSSGTVQELHKHCQYNRFNAPELARQYGLYALPNWHNLGWTKDTVKHELDMGRPVIMGVNQGRAGHFILAIGYTDDDRVIVHDPSSSALGYGLGGPNLVTDWKNLMWRGGIILRPEPFPEPPPLSGVAVGRHGGPLERTIDLRLTEGEDAEVSFTLVNNGRMRWPSPLYLAPVDPDSSPTRAIDSLIDHESWESARRVTKVGSGLEPGTTETVTFKITAPEVEETTTVLQYFNLHDSDGNWFGNNWLTGPGHRNMGVRMIVMPRDRPDWKLPLIGSMENGKPTLPWSVKSGQISQADGFTTAPPNGGPVARLYAPGHHFSSAWLGDPQWKDYRIEAWVYCNLRRDQKEIGWERVGIFARDNGQHVADTKNEAEIGHCLAMAFDSDDGSLRAGNVMNGAIRDYRDERHRLKKSGWHLFAITCKGPQVTYELDGELFHREENARGFREGDCGVYYNSAFDPSLPESAGPEGIFFSSVKVTEP